jgi:hypothetical protein
MSNETRSRDFRGYFSWFPWIVAHPNATETALAFKRPNDIDNIDRSVAMKRLALAILAVGALSAPALAATDCAKDYKEFVINLDRGKLATMSAEEIAGLSRTALRVYEACTSGDERFSATNFFKQLDSEKYSRADDIFRSGAFAPPGAKK